MQEKTALHFACVYGHPEVVAFLVENSCEISPKDIKDATPLIKAAQCRQTECLDILLKYGADPDIIDCRGNTALHYAVYNGDVKTAAKLLEYRASIEANKITPLLLALKQNKEKMAEFLINKGANTKTSRRWHPPLIPALGRQRQADLCEFEANLVCRMRSGIHTKTTQRNPVLKTKSKQKQKSLYFNKNKKLLLNKFG
uniref:Ankyrin repeat domain-containing protein 7 n=1 Tax=Peromyscus maniculatus bairdii TaxID=230844 RepID=A0A8C8UGM1_PERMB